MYKIIKKRNLFYIISGAMALLGIVSLISFGLRIGIDYKGGSIITYKTSRQSATQNIENTLKDLGYNNYQVKISGDNEITVRTENLDNAQHNQITDSVKKEIPGISETAYDNIGPTIGKDLTKKSIYAVVIASIAIIIFISFAFRRIPKPLNSWKFGVLAVLALLHDLLITIGFVSIIGHFFIWMEVDSLFITALLTIMGFSVHDTIVIYDRLRENFLRHKHKPIEMIAEESVNQTLARSINTSLTTIIVLFAMLLFGGTPIRHFILILIFGIFLGTYSSIFLAAPLVVSWHKNVKLEP